MSVWVWEARGQDRSSGGVADDEKRARKLAGGSLLAAGASDVLVEQALTALDATTLTYCYIRTGHGWRGHRTPRGRVTWRRFAAAGTRERTASRA